MKLNLSSEEQTALLKYLAESEDCEQLSEREWVADIYEIDTPVSLDLVFQKDQVFADGAEYLAFDEELGGWYMSGQIESADTIVELMRSSGALGA